MLGQCTAKGRLKVSIVVYPDIVLNPALSAIERTLINDRGKRLLFGDLG